MEELFKELVCKEFGRRWDGKSTLRPANWQEAWEAVVNDTFHSFDQDEYNDIGSAYHDAMNFDENVRVCSHCGKPMTSGYYLAGEYACSDECCLALYDGDVAQMKEDLSHACEDNCDTYYTDWEGNYFID